MKRILPVLLLGIMIMAELKGNAAVLMPIDHITDPFLVEGYSLLNGSPVIRRAMENLENLESTLTAKKTEKLAGYFGRTMPRISVKWCHIQKSYKDSISIDF